MTAPSDPRVRPGERGQSKDMQKLKKVAELAVNFDRFGRAPITVEAIDVLEVFDALDAARATIAARDAEIARLTAALTSIADLVRAKGDKWLGEAKKTSVVSDDYAGLLHKSDAAVEIERAIRLVSAEAKDAPSPAEGERS